MSDSLWLHWLQHARVPRPSPSPGACSNSCPLSQWCHPTISSLLSLSPPAFNPSQHHGHYPWVSSSHQAAKVLELQLQHQSFQWIFRVDFLQDWLVWSPCSARDSQESSPASQLKASILWHSAFFIVQLSYLYMTTGKTIALTIRTFVGKVMSLLFNMLSRSVIAFLPRSKHLLNFMAAVTVHRCVGLFLGSLLCSSEMHVCFCTNITLFWLL